jgi:exodeoxyribonuclease I
MGDGTGALNYEQALAETDRLLGEVAAADDLLSQYRAYLQERSARAAAFLARLMA